MGLCVGESYPDGQPGLLERVLAFNRALAAAGDAGLDLSEVTERLDPDPGRYLWIDEGGGRLGALVDDLRRLLDRARPLPGHVRHASRPIGGAGSASRPTVAGAPDGRIVVAWIDWEPGRGERVVATVLDEALQPVVAAAPLTGAASDCFRPTAVIDAAGRAWVFYARSAPGAAGSVAVYARCHDGSGWGPQQRVSTTGHPSFNQEAIGHADGSVECVWQGHGADGFGIYARRWRDGVWGATGRVDDGAARSAWDPSVAALGDGAAAYAWCAYREGAYRLVARYGDAGVLGPVRALTSGTDYALHPSLAVAGDGTVWCAFDLVTIHGHGGSGPTALQPAARLGDPPPLPTRDAGEYVPPELIPNTTAGVRVVRIAEDGVLEDPIALARGFEINPCGMPQLAAAAGGGLTVAYRVLRRLPLLHYYWEVAVQQLGPEGPGPVGTVASSDGGDEEPSVALAASGSVLACTTDRRRARALEWTEGFGGRRAAELAAHAGEVVWHGLHDSGEVVVAVLPDVAPPRAGVARRAIHGTAREEARAWVSGPGERYRTKVGGAPLTLYWGDLHRHSLISRCTAADDPGLEDFYRYAWDVCDYDFWAVTDHAENSSAHQWWTIKKTADLFRIPGRFVPLYGFEWTSDVGHQNVIYGDVARDAPIFSATADETDRPDKLWAHLRRFPDHPAVTIPHHPGAAMVPYDWSYYDPTYLRLVEVFQACRGNYEDDGAFRQYADATLPGTFTVDGLRHGHRFGFVASSDHGYGASYVGAYAPALDRAAVFDALARRRTIAATAKGIVLDVRIGDTFLGGAHGDGGPVEMRAAVRAYRDLARIEVVRNGRLAHAVTPQLDLPSGWLAVPLRIEWGRAAGRQDWSGVLTVTGGEVLQTPWWSPEIRTAGRATLSWEAATHGFGGGGLYRPTRGGIDLTVVGPPRAKVRVKTAAGAVAATLESLQHGPVTAEGPDAPGEGMLRLQPGTGGLTSLGSTSHELAWTDPVGPPAWYYVRAFLVDGEMAWSSPIWVDLPA